MRYLLEWGSTCHTATEGRIEEDFNHQQIAVGNLESARALSNEIKKSESFINTQSSGVETSEVLFIHCYELGNEVEL